MPSAKKLAREHSEELWERALKVIPIGTQTFGKSPRQWGFGTAPNYLQRGEGSHVWDVDGNEYIDYGMALGPIILGYNYPRVNEAILSQLEQASILSLNHPIEVELAELLVELIPCAEMVRFGKNGSDATSAAVRLARAHTGRDVILCSGYHGWQDWYIGSTSRSAGVPQAVRDLTVQFPYNDVDYLKNLFEKYSGAVAAVIMEPSNFEAPHAGYLEAVKELTHRHGAVLIFDEVLTGFRMSLGGAQQYFGITPDLAIFAKAMANGMPISALVGKAELMELFSQVFYSFTFASEMLSMAASLATIRELREKNALPEIWKRGGELKKGCLDLIAEYGLEGTVSCTGYEVWLRFAFSDSDGRATQALETLFRQEVTKRGILMRTSTFVCYAHSAPDIQKTLEAYGEAFEILAHAKKQGNVEELLEGPIIEPVIRGQLRVSG